LASALDEFFLNPATMPIIRIETLDDPRIEPYRNLKLKNLQRGGTHFIAEGKKVVERLLDSHFQTASVFISQKREAEWLTKVSPELPLFVAPQEIMNEIVGFDFHVGVLGCGCRPERMPLEMALSRQNCRLTVVVCPNCDNPENMGAIIRIGAAFGIDALILGDTCCDPYSRRVIRVSMGATFSLPIIESADLVRDLERLKSDWQFELAATVLSHDAEPLEMATRGPRFAILMGNEDTGLEESWTQICNRKLTIPMSRGIDSLNVAVSAGIMLFHFSGEKSNTTV
jgi:tRNA G18 (ribose-2'-O)-methylase SpoU